MDNYIKQRILESESWAAAGQVATKLLDEPDVMAWKFTPHTKNEATTKMSKVLGTQVGGTHYTDLKIQPFELTYANFGYIGLKAAVYTKVNKYMTRSKDNEVQQLQKAAHSLAILIEKAQEEAAALENLSIDYSLQTR